MEGEVDARERWRRSRGWGGGGCCALPFQVTGAHVGPTALCSRAPAWQLPADPAGAPASWLCALACQPKVAMTFSPSPYLLPPSLSLLTGSVLLPLTRLGPCFRRGVMCCY